MPISAKWKHKSSIHIGFIVFNGGVTTFFAKSVYHGALTKYAKIAGCACAGSDGNVFFATDFKGNR